MTTRAPTVLINILKNIKFRPMDMPTVRATDTATGWMDTQLLRTVKVKVRPRRWVAHIDIWKLTRRKDQWINNTAKPILSPMIGGASISLPGIASCQWYSLAQRLQVIICYQLSPRILITVRFRVWKWKEMHKTVWPGCFLLVLWVSYQQMHCKRLTIISTALTIINPLHFKAD